MTNPQPLSNLPPKRAGFPFYLWVLIFGLLWQAGMAALRFGGALSQWGWLNTLGVKPGPLYIAISGAVFAVGFAAGVVGVLMRKPWARWLVRGVAAAYAVWFWVDRLVIAQNRVGFAWPFALGASVVLLGFTFAALAASRDLFEKR